MTLLEQQEMPMLVRRQLTWGSMPNLLEPPAGADDTAAEALCDAEVLVAKAALDGRQGGGKGGGRRAPVGCFPMFFK